MQALAQGVDSASRDAFSPVLDCAQHLRQTHGWDTSWKVLQSILRDSGPFDGIMGFSQVRLYLISQQRCPRI